MIDTAITTIATKVNPTRGNHRRVETQTDHSSKDRPKNLTRKSYAARRRMNRRFAPIECLPSNGKRGMPSSEGSHDPAAVRTYLHCRAGRRAAGDHMRRRPSRASPRHGSAEDFRAGPAGCLWDPTASTPGLSNAPFPPFSGLDFRSDRLSYGRMNVGNVTVRVPELYSKKWWTRGESNPRPSECHSRFGLSAGGRRRRSRIRNLHRRCPIRPPESTAICPIGCQIGCQTRQHRWTISLLAQSPDAASASLSTLSSAPRLPTARSRMHVVM